MPQLTVDVKANKNLNSRTVSLFIQQVKNNQRQNAITTEQHLENMNTVLQVAEWILQQTPPQTEPEHEINRRLTINFHTEQAEDEDGKPITIKVLDSVDSQPLPENKAKNQFNMLPVFSDSLNGIDNWIDASIVDLPTAKQALAQLAKACFYLQVQLNNGSD
jgi:hypothetical protein